MIEVLRVAGVLGLDPAFPQCLVKTVEEKLKLQLTYCAHRLWR